MVISFYVLFFGGYNQVKKLLSLIGTISIVGSGASAVVACGGDSSGTAGSKLAGTLESKLKGLAVTPAKKGSKQSTLTPATTSSAAQAIIDKIKQKNIEVPNGTNPEIANSETITAMKSALYQANKVNGLTQADLSFLKFTGGDLVDNQAVPVKVTATVKSKSASTTLAVSLLSSKGTIVPTGTGQLSNFNINDPKVAPPAAPSGINYKKAQYSPWFDDGFNWEQFLNEAGIGNHVINDILDSSNQIVRLGFITSSDAKAFAQAQNSPVINAFKQYAQNNTSQKIVTPSVGGVLPLWMANWTDKYGNATPAQPTAAADTVYQFLTQIRNAGKDYEFSFGGWNHDSLAMSAELMGYSANKLANLYASIINAFKLKIMDFDIEGTDSGSTDDFGNKHPIQEGDKARELRMQALTILKNDPRYSNVIINFTYPAYLNGIEGLNNNQLLNAFRDGIINDVNAMAFDYSLWGYNKRITLPGETSIYAMSSVNAIADELKGAKIADPYTRIQATLMAGIEDQKYQVTTLTDLRLFTNFAITHKLAGISFWSSLYDMEQWIYNANKGELRPGHSFGLWNFNDMLTNGRKKDAYASGLKVQNLSYSNIAKNFTEGSLYKYQAANKPLDQNLWKGIKDAGILPSIDPSNITDQDFVSLYSTNFSFSNALKAVGFGPTLTTAPMSKAALQNELKLAQWSNQYLDKNLQ